MLSSLYYLLTPLPLIQVSFVCVHDSQVCVCFVLFIYYTTEGIFLSISDFCLYQLLFPNTDESDLSSTPLLWADPLGRFKDFPPATHTAVGSDF